ncbi:MAG: hypothetical protein OEW18_14925 [Candidatus Aminicenantes bacterium]|nr:hypothetical protein [Candidatus Aminicenantes bacterium]
MNRIEKMNRFRKNLLKGILWASGIWTALLVIWILLVINQTVKGAPFARLTRFIPGAVFISAFIVLFFLLRYWRYKWTLRRDPALRSALDDERVRLSWLKAYRFAFFTVVVFHVLFLLNGSFFQIIFRRQAFRLPGFAEYPLTLLLAVLSCLGSFLHYSRED